MPKIEIYTTPYCPYCVRAKQLLDQKGVTYQEIDVSNDPERKAEMIQRSQRHTVPQIFIDEQPYGGCDDLFELNHAGKLDKLLFD
jgi:glutaredoxin 3